MTMDNPFTRSTEASPERSHVDEEQSNGSGGQDAPDVPAPFAPNSDEDSPLGDTDEHSDA
jgi:hypothetical protein